MKRITYFTMNSWNKSTAPAYNMKVYRVIPSKLQNKVFQLMECQDFYEAINDKIHEFDIAMAYKFQAGFNGRSGGYLVLYRGGIENNRVFTRPGQSIDPKEVPGHVLRAFSKLAHDILRMTIAMAKNNTVIEEEVLIPKTIKRIA